MLSRLKHKIKIISIDTSYHGLQRVTVANKLTNLNKNYWQEAVKFKAKGKNTSATDKLSCDDKTQHPHLMKHICPESTCETKKCAIPCQPPVVVRSQGYATHKPIAGKAVLFLDDIDAKNKEDTQYYVKNKDKTKQVTGTEYNQYKQTGQVKPDKDMDTYMKKPDIEAKIDE